MLKDIVDFYGFQFPLCYICVFIQHMARVWHAEVIYSGSTSPILPCYMSHDDVI